MPIPGRGITLSRSAKKLTSKYRYVFVLIANLFGISHFLILGYDYYL
jgi:hypothetical protein